MMSYLLHSCGIPVKFYRSVLISECVIQAHISKFTKNNNMRLLETAVLIRGDCELSSVLTPIRKVKRA